MVLLHRGLIVGPNGFLSMLAGAQWDPIIFFGRNFVPHGQILGKKDTTPIPLLLVF